MFYNKGYKKGLDYRVGNTGIQRLQAFMQKSMRILLIAS